MVAISGVNIDSLADWCQCRDRKTGAYIPLVVKKYYHQAQHYFKIGDFAPENVPPFLISMGDLKKPLVCELAKLDQEDRDLY